MDKIKICRICLTKDVKLFELEQFRLKYYYEQMMNSKMETDNLPCWFCFECAALLHKYYKFKEKCGYAQKTLKDLFCKGYMTYEVIEDIRKNRVDLLSSVNYVITNKHIKTYNMKHKPEIKPKEIENVLINKFNDIEYEYIPETDDDNITLDKCNSTDEKYSKDLKLETIVAPETETYDLNNYDNDDFDLEPLQNTPKYEIDEETELKNSPVTTLDTEDNSDVYIVDNEPNISPTENCENQISATEVNENQISATEVSENQLLNLEDNSKDSLLNTKPKQIKKKSEANNTNLKPKKFEKQKRVRLNKDNWEIKILSEDEALEQFKQRINDTKYRKFNFKCHKCLKGFSRNDILSRHNKKCHDEGSKFECRFCHMLFKRKFLLGQHMVVHYYVYKCLRCDLKCNFLSSAIVHEESHNGVTRTCKHCGEQFKHVSTYYTHLRLSHRSSHTCTLCGASFVSGTGLQYHMKRQHFKADNTAVQDANIYCEKCDVSFVSQLAFDGHISQSASHEGEQTRKQRSRRVAIDYCTTCKYCYRKFESKTEVKEHIAEEHPEKSKAERVVCDICGAELAATYLAIHLNRHNRSKVYKCEICSKEFLCTTGFKAHLRTHTGERPYSCEICHKRFVQKGQKDLHYKHTHLKEPYPKRTYNRKNRSRQPSEVPLFASLITDSVPKANKYFVAHRQGM